VILFKRILVLVFGTAAGQIITLLATPVLARLYLPQDFGYFATVTALVMIFSGVASLKYETAIMINDKKTSQAALFLLSIILLFLTSLLFIVIIKICGGTELYSKLIPDAITTTVIVLMYIFLGMINIMNNWHARHKRYYVLSSSKAIMAATIVVLQYVLFDVYGGSGLIIGSLIGFVVAAIFLSYFIFKYDVREISESLTLNNLRTAAYNHKRFPQYSVFATILNSIANQIPSVLFAQFISLAYAGYYSMSWRLTKGPVGLIGQSIFQVVSQHVGHNVNNIKEVQDTTNKVLGVMVHTSAPFFVLGAFLIEPAILLILGEEWDVAGELSRKMLPWLFCLYLSWSMTGILNSMGYQKIILFFNMFFVAALVIPFLLTSDIDLVVFLIVFLGSLTRLMYIYWTLRSIQVRSISVIYPVIIYWVVSMLSSFGALKVI